MQPKKTFQEVMKMAVTLKNATTKTHHICIEANGNLLTVSACPLLGGGLCGYPDNQCVYHYSERKQAFATFRRYCKKYE